MAIAAYQADKATISTLLYTQLYYYSESKSKTIHAKAEIR